MTLSNELVPRRRWRWRWWIALFVVLLLSWTLFQLFGPNPRIVVSPETTVITSPLRPDGLPDYTKYLRDLGREGVTPENNGAVLFWQAMWPGELERKDWEPLCEALGMQDIPSPDRSLQSPFSKDVEDEVGLWLVRQVQPDFSPVNCGLTTQQLGRFYFQTGSERTIWMALSRPWTSEQCPPLATWLAKHQEQFDLLIAASKRTKFWSPSPSLLDNVDENTMYRKVPESWTMWTAGRVLSLRAFWHVGEGRTDAAWEDLLACYRLARHLSRGTCLYDEHLAMSMDRFTNEATTIVLHHGNPNPKMARRILSELNALAPLKNIPMAVKTGTQINFAASAIGLATGRDTVLLLGRQQFNFGFEPTEYLRIDWNYVLCEGNRLHKQLLDAISLSTRRERKKALDRLCEELGPLEQSLSNPRALIGGIVNPSDRNDLAVGFLTWAALPYIDGAFDEMDSTRATFEQTRIAAALAVYRAMQGEYPESLDELVPALIESTPIDPYSDAPFRYRRKQDGGYLSYGFYENGVDDGGTSISGEIVKGEWVTQEHEFTDDVFDLVIRVPVPAFEAKPDAVNMNEITRY